MFSFYPIFAILSILAAPIAAPAEQATAQENRLAFFIDWLFEEGQKLEEIPLSLLIETATEKSVIPIDPTDPKTLQILETIGSEAEELLRELNNPDHPIHSVGRINEVSGHIEDYLQQKLDALDGFSCDFPKTAGGRIQRSGYPDLRLVENSTGHVFYIDPKLYATGSERSSFRSFYFEPKLETSKILDDASHLILGIAHGGRRPDGSWHFLRWRLVDVSSLKVRLKAEFQAGNRDLYRADSTVAEGKVSGKIR